MKFLIEFRNFDVFSDGSFPSFRTAIRVEFPVGSEDKKMCEYTDEKSTKKYHLLLK